MDIDLVYLWVDASDPAWLAKKRATTGDFRAGSDTDDVARWVNNDELKYSLRSTEKFAPWIRKVFIVTDNQTPEWLDTSNPRVQIVDHSDIMPPEALPCFNSAVIEYFLHRIPDLSERFLYSNDDMFFGAPLPSEFFFATDGFPIVRLKRKAMGKLRFVVKRLTGISFGYYRRSIFRASLMVERVTGKYFSGVPHHNIDAYLRDDNRRVLEEIFAPEITASLDHHVRADGDVQRIVSSYWGLAMGRAHLRYITSHLESQRISVHKPNFINIYERSHPKLFCLNDDQHASNDDRARIRPFLEELFPDKCSFEK